MSSETLPRTNYGKIRLFLIVLIFVGLQLLLTLHLRMSSAPPVEPGAEKIEAYNPELFKVMSFGQMPTVIDWMWLKTLEDPLISHVKKGTHPQIFYVLDLITTIDPAYMDAYTVGATLVSVIRDDGPGALHLLLKAEDFRKTGLLAEPAKMREVYWSGEWEVPFLLAYVYLFDMDDMPHAADAYREAALMPGSPSYLKGLVQQLATQRGQYEVALRLVDFMAEESHDPDIKRRLLERRTSLGVSYFLFSANERLADFLRAHRFSKKGPFANPSREKIWGMFLKATGLAENDPWGGRLSLDKGGKITTATPHRKVFGLQ